MSEPKTIYEHTTDDDVPEDFVDGMDAMMGDDILSSDYVEGQEWPGVNMLHLPDAYKREGQVDRVPYEK